MVSWKSYCYQTFSVSGWKSRVVSVNISIYSLESTFPIGNNYTKLIRFSVGWVFPCSVVKRAPNIISIFSGLCLKWWGIIVDEENILKWRHTTVQKQRNEELVLFTSSLKLALFSRLVCIYRIWSIVHSERSKLEFNSSRNEMLCWKMLMGRECSLQMAIVMQRLSRIH